MSDALMDLSSVDTAALLPSSVSSDLNIAAMLTALDAEWKAIATAIPLLGVLATIDLQPEEVVDRLAYDFHVDYYPADAELSIKRQIVKDSVRLHRIAGTRGAVEDVIRSVWGDGAILSEWWEHGGEPGTFRVTLTNGQTQGNVEAFLFSIRKVKRATDHLQMVIPNDCDPGPTHWAAVHHTWTDYSLEA